LKPITNIDDPRYVKALAHPLRVRILAILEEGEHSPTKIANLLGASLGVVAYHVRTLHQLGLVDLVSTTPRRGAIEHHYRAKERPRVSATAWQSASAMAKQALVGSTLQQVNEYVSGSAAVGGFDRPDAHLTRTAMRLDERGWDELAAACARLLEDVARIESDVAERIEDDPDTETLDAGLVLMHFEALPFSDRSPAPARASRRRPVRATSSS
jgi:DNA-binding transcriptional ArsR family regulator